MATWCDSCGQQLPDGEAPRDMVWLGEPGEPHQHLVRPTGTKKSGAEKKLLLGIGAIVLVWGLFVGLGRIVTPDDAIDEQAAADIEDARIEREVARVLAEAEEDRQAAEAAVAAAAASDESGEVDDDDVEEDLDQVGTRDGDDFVSADDRIRISVQVERLQRQLARRDIEAYVAYESAGGVVVVDLVNAEATVTELAPGVGQPVPGARLLRTGATTFSIDVESLAVRRVGEDSSVVVSDALDGNTYFVDADALSGQASMIEVVADGSTGFHRMPAGGFQLLPVDGLGLLAVPKGPTGETLIAGADEFTVLSENRVLTGTSQAVLEQICSSETSCTLALTDLMSGEQTEVPASFVRFGDQYVVAPNGRSLLRYSPEGFAEVFVADSGSIAWVVGAGMRAPAWSPTSDFIAWIDRIGDPTLKVMFPDERDWLSIDLRDLGAPGPISDDVTVFAPATPAESG